MATKRERRNSLVQSDTAACASEITGRDLTDAPPVRETPSGKRNKTRLVPLGEITVEQTLLDDYSVDVRDAFSIRRTTASSAVRAILFNGAVRWKYFAIAGLTA